MYKYDNLVIVFAGNQKEFKTYIQMLIEKKWVLKFDFLEKNQALIATNRRKLVLLKYMGTKDSIVGINFSDEKTEVNMVGTWYNHKWIANILQDLKSKHPDLKFKSKDIKIKPSL